MGILKILARSTRRLPSLTLAAGAGWTAYSALGIPHEVPLPRPVPGEAGHIDSVEVGRVAVYEMGPADGRPVVLVHGVHAAASAYDMRPLYTSLASAGHRVVALDLPGFGHSDRSPRRYDPATMVAAVAAVMEHTTSGPADVVALSLGCEFAAAVAKDRMDLVRSLALISPTGFGSAPPSLPTRLGALLRTPVLGQAAYDLLSSRPSIEYFLGLNFAGDVDPGYTAHAWATAHQPGARHAPASFLDGTLFADDAVESIYAKVTHPTLVIYDEDPHTSFVRLPEEVARLGWQAQRIEPSRGLPHFEHPEQTVQTLQRFWTEHAHGDSGGLPSPHAG